MLSSNQGFAIVMALLSLLLISIIGATGLTIVNTNLQTTTADERLNLAEKAANAGLLKATDMVNSSGICTTQQLNENLGNAQYIVNIKRSGRICFIRSEGRAANAKVLKTSIVQSFYGLGLYTVRGNVNANLGGSSVRLSGCDSTVTPTCFLPAFIASGTINSSLTQRQCSQDSGASGLYGNPAVYPDVIFQDLIPLFFNVDCFNKRTDSNCGVGLLQVFENEYGRNPDPANENDPDRRLDMIFDNEWGLPRVNNQNLPTVPLTVPTVPNNPGCTTANNITALNLSTDFTNCSEIIIPTTGTKNLTISGNGNRGGQPVRIYDQRNGGNRTISASTQNFILDVRTSNRTLSINNGAGNFTVYNNGTTTITNSSGFTAYGGANSSITVIGDGVNNSANNFTVYNRGTTTYRSLNSGIIRGFRHRSTNNVTIDNNTVLEDGTIIIAQNNNDDINTLNNANINLNLIANGTFTMRNMNLFVRSMRFADNSTINIHNSLIYLYTYACPNCSRAASNSSLNACITNDRWCGWVGNSPGNRFALNLGRGPNNEQWPVLIISNNTTVHSESLPGTAYIWGAFVGQDVTYLRWIGAPTQSFRGFLIRNFPPNLSLNINIGGNFTLEFRKSIIDQLSERYWFFRKIDCIRDDINPLTQTVQTGLTAY